VNLSSTNIPEEVQCLLQLGNNFNLPPKNKSQRLVFDLVKNIESNLFKLDPVKAADIRNSAVQFLEKFLSSSPSLSEIERSLLNMARLARVFLAEHPDLIITRADKGNTTVALDKAICNDAPRMHRFPGRIIAGSCRPAEHPPGRGKGAVRPHFKADKLVRKVWAA